MRKLTTSWILAVLLTILASATALADGIPSQWRPIP
jgi:hypothetical protein